MPVEILWNCSGNVWGNLSGNNVQRRVDLDLVLEKCWTLEKKTRETFVSLRLVTKIDESSLTIFFVGGWYG